MLKTFKAWLRGSRVEWMGEVPEFGDRIFQVQVTFLDEQPVLETKTRGRRMAEILENLAATKFLSEVDPVLWQREIREDRSLPGR